MYMAGCTVCCAGEAVRLPRSLEGARVSLAVLTLAGDEFLQANEIRAPKSQLTDDGWTW